MEVQVIDRRSGCSADGATVPRCGHHLLQGQLLRRVKVRLPRLLLLRLGGLRSWRSRRRCHRRRTGELLRRSKGVVRGRGTAGGSGGERGLKESVPAAALSHGGLERQGHPQPVATVLEEWEACGYAEGADDCGGASGGASSTCPLHEPGSKLSSVHKTQGLMFQVELHRVICRGC